MHRSKLFRALVIGGGMTAVTLLSCGDETGENSQKSSNGSSPASQTDSTSVGNIQGRCSSGIG